MTVLAVSAATLCACASQSEIPIPPVQYAGSVGNVFRTRQFGDEPRQIANQVNTFIDLNSYIWQPWFITLAGGLELATEMERGGTSGDSDALRFGGDVSIGVLPLSRYPTTLSYSHTDSRISGEFTGSDFVRDRVGVNSNLVLASDLRANMTASHESTDQPDLGSESRQQAGLSVSKLFEHDRLSLAADFQQSDFDSRLDDDTEEMRLLGRVRYDSAPLRDVTTQSVSTVLYSVDETEERDLDELSLQSTVTAQWRPRTRPFTVNGALRTLNERRTFDTGGSEAETNNLLAAATAGLNYPVNERLVANIGASADVQSVTRDAGALAGEATSQAQNSAGADMIGSLNYESPSQDVAGFDWRWQADSSVDLGYDTQTRFDNRESASLGHTFQRTFESMILAPVQFSASQQATVAHSTDEGVVPSLFHAAHLTHRSFDPGISTFARLSLSDRRDIAISDPDEFQLAQFQLSRQTLIDVRRSWTASLSLQASRQRTAGASNFTTSADGTVTYQERDLFLVENLSYLSELRLSAVGLEDVLSDGGDTVDTSNQFRSDWRNILEYRIGRLVTSLEATVFQNREQFGNLIMLRIRRDFSGMF
ncbi:MAG: hypothetical protein D6826_08975 [Alphaproteobacteria bacterium]|nr:MAG: hypothetical protein D6826_08975 [Alphaproteobacteria bacterium]